MSEKKFHKTFFYALVFGLLLSFAPFISTDAACTKLCRMNVTLVKGEHLNLKIKSCKGGVTWCSNNKNVAKVNKKGMVTANNNGKAVITAKTCGKMLKCTVYVCNPDRTFTDANTVKNNAPAPVSMPQAVPVPSAIPPDSIASGITEEGAFSILNSLRNTYPEGMPLNNSYYYYSKVFGHGYGCYGFASMLSDMVFGKEKSYSTHSNFASIRVGDNIRIGNRHSVICLTKEPGLITVVEGNYNSSVHWDRKITKSSLEKDGFKVYTRY